MTPSWLSQLAPDRAPPPLAWWHLAPGWWGLAALLASALVLAIWWRRRPRRPSFRHWQRAALHELAQLQATSSQEVDSDATIARGLQQLLRRYAVVRHGRERVAALNGDAWIAFVVDHGGTAWAGETGRRLLRCAYGGDVASRAGTAEVRTDDRERWFAGARAFVKARG